MEIEVGSIIIVHCFRKQTYIGVCSNIRRRGSNTTFTVRSFPQGVEYTFHLFSPYILAIQLAQ